LADSADRGKPGFASGGAADTYIRDLIGRESRWHGET